MSELFFLLVIIFFAFFLWLPLFIYLEKGLTGFKNIWDYIFDPWEITVEKVGKEIWQKRYPQDLYHDITGQSGKVVLNSGFNKDFVVYRYTHKFNKKEKIVKKYLD